MVLFPAWNLTDFKKQKPNKLVPQVVPGNGHPKLGFGDWFGHVLGLEHDAEIRC